MPTLTLYACLFQVHAFTQLIDYRVFSMAAPNVCSSLPIDIRSTDCLSTFHKKLKTHFYSSLYMTRHIHHIASVLELILTPGRSINSLLCFVMLLPQVKELPSPYGDCNSSDDYLQSKCLSNCQAKYVVKKCNSKEVHMQG